MEVDALQADVVRQVFEWYASGWSPKAIARELNRRRVPSPGSLWKRVERRTAGWVPSAIAGDVSRGTGILNNDLYQGVVVWNRSRWVRSAADSAKRRCVPNPPTEWVTRADESLRIVPQPLWGRVKARQRHQTVAIGERIKAGMSRGQAQRTGRSPGFLFSGLLKCGECGANFVMAGKNHYACATRVYGELHKCSNDIYLRRSLIEPGLLAGIKRKLSTAEVLEEFQQRLRRRLKNGPIPTAASERAHAAKLEREVSALVDAIASGALRSSPALAKRLQETEAALAHLKARPATATVEQLLPQIAEQCRKAIDGLEQTLISDARRARADLAEYVGPIRVTAMADEVRLEAQSSHLESVFLAATGTGGPRQICMVAGARYQCGNSGLACHTAIFSDD